TEPADDVVPRHRDQGERSRRRDLRPRLLDARRLLDLAPAHTDERGHDRRGAGASVQAGRRAAHSAQRRRRHAVSARGAARAQSARRRDARLLARTTGERERHDRRVRFDGSGGATSDERTRHAGQGSGASTGAKLLDRAALLAAGERRRESLSLGLAVRQPASVLALVRDQREPGAHTRIATRTGRASGNVHDQADGRRKDVYPNRRSASGPTRAGYGGGDQSAARAADEIARR